jgi:hypothetical protein
MTTPPRSSSLYTEESIPSPTSSFHTLEDTMMMMMMMIPPDPLTQQRALHHLQEVIEFIAPERKASYQRALRECSDLVETESNPLKFLQFEQYNSWSAAERLVTYWNKRQEWFGDRAFLPMNLSGQGALSEDDVNYMASGLELMMITTGNIVIYDRTLTKDTVEDSIRIKMRFFFLQKLIDPCWQAKEGPRVLIRGFSINLARTRVNRETRILIEQAFPIPNIEEVHLTYIREKHQTLWEYIVPFGIQQIAGLASQFKVHNCDSVEELAESFARHNISRSSLPVALGGYYNQNVNFVRFLLDNGYPAAKLGDSLATNNSRNNPRKRTQDHLNNLVDYFISKAPELPDLQDSEPLGLGKYLQSLLLKRNSDPPTPRLEHITEQPNHVPSIAVGNMAVPLALSSDEDFVSEYQCALRQHIEFFQATKDDTTSSARGRNKPIALGQVGIRCRHCAHLPRQQRCKAATYYPTKLDRIYQTALNLARIHLMDACQHIPLEYRQQLQDLCTCKSFMGTGKEYWSDAAQLCGVVEEQDMLRFQ